MKNPFKSAFIILLVLFLVFAGLGIYYNTAQKQGFETMLASLKAMLGDEQTMPQTAAPQITAPQTAAPEYTALNETIASLETRNAALERELQTFRSQGADQSRIIESLSLERDVLQQQLSDITAERDTLQGRITELQRQLEVVRALLQN